MLTKLILRMLFPILLLFKLGYCTVDDELDILLRGPAGSPPNKSFAVMEEVSQSFYKIDNITYEISVKAPLTDTTECRCPAWFSYPIAGLHFFGLVVKEIDSCAGLFPLNGINCRFSVFSGDKILKHFLLKKETMYKELRGNFKADKYYLQGENISLRDSSGYVPSRTGVYPIYEIDSSYALIDISLTQQQNCSHGTLFGKVNLFTFRGLPLRIMIDLSKSTPVVKRIK